MLSHGIGKNAAPFSQVQLNSRKIITEKITHVIVVVQFIINLKVKASVFF